MESRVQVKEVTWKKRKDTSSSEVKRKEKTIVTRITCTCGARR